MATIVLLNSGGLDSAMLAKKLNDDGHVIRSLFVNSHQLNSVATGVAAAETATRFCDSHVVFDYDLGQTSNAIMHGTTLEFHAYDAAVANGKWAQYLANRSDWVLSTVPSLLIAIFGVGFGYAMLNGVQEVHSALRGGMVGPNWLDMLGTIQHEELFPQWHPTPVLDVAALTGYAEVATWAGVADITTLEYTHSCKEDPPCQVCAKCVARNALGMEY